MKKLLLICGTVFILSACSYSSSKFTEENIMNLKIGMNIKEIEKKFGKPKGVRVTTCGGDNPWTCKIWEYENYYTGQSASFYFYKDDGTWRLNNYNIDR